MARRYLIWYEWEGGVEERKTGQRKGRVPRSRGMSEEGEGVEEEGIRAEQSSRRGRSIWKEQRTSQLVPA
jgi:hypothetical protein